MTEAPQNCIVHSTADSLLGSDSVVEDKEESHNLANSSEHASIFQSLLQRFRQLSTTGVPMAGLPPALLASDDKVKCAALKTSGAFEPYGPTIAWPAPTPPAAPSFYCKADGSGQCVESSAAGSEAVKFTSAVSLTAQTCVCKECLSNARATRTAFRRAAGRRKSAPSAPPPRSPVASASTPSRPSSRTSPPRPLATAALRARLRVVACSGTLGTVWGRGTVR